MIALALSLLALLRNWRSSRWEKQSAEAADRSANEAARANLIAQRALELAESSKAPPDHEPGPPNVAWRIERGSGAEYVLRNTGQDIAEQVDVDESRAPIINRNLPNGAVVGPGQGHRMLLKGSWQQPMPTELYLRWAGQDDWVAVPLP